MMLKHPFYILIPAFLSLFMGAVVVENSIFSLFYHEQWGLFLILSVIVLLGLSCGFYLLIRPLVNNQFDFANNLARQKRELSLKKQELSLTKQKLSRREKRSKSNQKLSNSSYLEWDLKTDTLRFSSKVLSFLEANDTEIIHHHDDIYKFVHIEDRENLKETHLKCKQSEKIYETSYRVIMGNGLTKWILERGEVIYLKDEKDLNKNAPVINVVMSDITEQKHYQENLKNKIEKLKESDELSELLLSALNAASDSIVIVNRNAVIEWVNPAYIKLTGYKLEEVIGKNPKILNSGKHPESFFKDLWETILQGNAWHGEIWNKRKDGSLYLEEQSITPTFDARGLISHFIAIKRDVSEQRLMQKRILKSQKMESIGQLTGGIAHDFNNMLASILGYTELAMEEFNQQISQEARHATQVDSQIMNYLSEVYKSGGRARDLVSQMLAFSREGETEHQPLAVYPLLNESLKMLVPILPSSIKFDLQIDDKNLVVLTDSVQFNQMFMNLCINAKDAMDERGNIVVGLRKTSNIDLICSSCHEKVIGDFIEFYVQDDGSGIKEETLARIFDPFFTTKDAGKGTGMGLSIVHGIMHDQNGHILVKSDKNKGTTFSLMFPVMPEQTLRNPPENLIADSKTALNKSVNSHSKSKKISLKGHILIVDDETSIGFLLSEILQMAGAHTTVETDVLSALELFKAQPETFDLVVTDQTMPGMSGIEFAQTLLTIKPKLPIILCSGYSEKVDESKAKSLGISAYIQKPIETDRLLELAERLLIAKSQPKSTL